MNTIEKAEFTGLRAAVEAGTGLAGWHGGIADSYRNTSDYLHLIGGQFACHPGKPADQHVGDASDNFLTYTVNMLPAAADHPITRGISDFDGDVLLQRLGDGRWQTLPVSAGYVEASRGIGLQDLASTAHRPAPVSLTPAAVQRVGL